MLILSRREDEKIYIGDKIVITVIEIRGGRARIGIDAPADVSIVRGELWNERQEALKKKS